MTRGPRVFAVIPAAGGGSRFGGGLPKQYAMIAARPVLARTIDRLSGSLALDALCVVIASDDAHYDAVIAPVLRAPPGTVEVLRRGGASRAETVANALAELRAHCAPDDWVLVHDAARPCTPVDALRRLVTELADDPIGGLLAIPAADTLKRDDGATWPRVVRTEDRERLWQAQTPQLFRYGVLAAAMAMPEALSCSDEAQAIERSGIGAPRLVLGSAQNVKITYPSDLTLAIAIHAVQERGG